MDDYHVCRFLKSRCTGDKYCGCPCDDCEFSVEHYYENHPDEFDDDLDE